MSNPTFLLTMALLLASPQVLAQSDSPQMDPAMCEQFATMAAAPMSVASCKSMLGVAVDDPATHRPGDEAMSCKQIFAELKKHQPAGVSAEQGARDEALVQQAATMNERHAKMNAVESAPEAAALRAASVMPRPLAVPIAAAAEASLTKKRAVATKRYLDESHQVTAGSAAMIERTFGQDPRLKRLSQLAVKKDCSSPDG